MRKYELEAEVVKLKRKNAIYRTALIEVRQNARECVPKNASINNVWAIEKVTEAIAKADSI